MTTKEDILAWLGRAKARDATHMMVVCDTFDHSDYPVFAASREEAKARYDAPGEMQRVIEIYDLSLDWDAQLAEHRAFHL